MADEPEVSRPDSEEEEEGGPVKSFLEHLEDLRWVLIKCGAALGLAMVACLAASPQLVRFLLWPKRWVEGITVNPMGPAAGVVISMKIALYGGITLSLPFILYFIGQFVLPALKKHEKKYFLAAFCVGAGLFLAGVFMCYFLVLNLALKGMAQYNIWLNLPSDIWRAEDYFSFILVLMMGMGLSFEIPVVILTLVRIGLLPHEWVVKGRKYFFVANLTIVSIITPDFLSTFFIVIPVQILMEICILISAYWERQKKSAAELAAASHRSDQPSSAD